MLRKHLSNIFINVVQKEKSYTLECYSVKNEELLKTQQRFYTEEEKPKALKFLKDIIDSHYFSYVSLLFTSIGQGMIPTTNKNDLQKFGVDDSAVFIKTLDDAFLYASKVELDAVNTIIDELYVDLIYSPFAILAKLIKDKRTDGFTYHGFNLFVLKYGEFVAVMIYEDANFRFGSFFELKNKENEEEEENEELELEVEPNTDTLEELNFEEFDNIKLDDDFNLDDNLSVDMDDEGLNTFNLDMQIFEYINSAIKEFYENPLYESDFLSNIIIFEHEKSSKAMHSYIESELLIKPVIYKIDIFKEMLKLSSLDLGVKIDI